MAGTLIRGATLIDGTGRAPIRGSDILVADGRIVAAGPIEQVQQRAVASEARTIDAGGRWVIPGLIDSHVHVALTGIESLPIFLACGVTTIRDVGGPLDVVTDVRDSIQTDGLAAPRFIFCGPLIDGESPSFPNAVLPIIESTANPSAAADLAERCIERGAGAIKLYFRLPRASVRAVIERVRGRVPVTGHLGRTYASEAVADGINSIEHAIITLYNDVVGENARFDAMQASMADRSFWTGLFAGWAGADLSAKGAQALLVRMRERDVTLDPTLDITRNGLGTPPPSEEDPREKYARRELLVAWQFVRQSAPPASEADAAIAERGHARCDDFVRRYHELGGRVTAGTDVGAVPFIVPGFSLHDEIAMLVRAGLSPAAALKAATLDAATALRIDADTGSIEPGKIADVVILDDDPLADIANLGRVHSVMRAGMMHDPATLLATATP